jgi:hypothetical protein
LTKRQADTCRSHIQTTKILQRLQDHVHGKVILDATQVQSARILLAKSIPDLSSVEMQVEDTTPARSIEELIAQGKQLGLTPEQMFGRKPRK